MTEDYKFCKDNKGGTCLNAERILELLTQGKVDLSSVEKYGRTKHYVIDTTNEICEECSYTKLPGIFDTPR